MASSPWAGASSHEQLFVLLTGANSGVGLGIGQRIIDEFLASRSLSSHLILLPTTRSVKKSRETVLALRAHLNKTAHKLPRLEARYGSAYDPQNAIARVHVLSVQLDLCDLRSVYAAADQLVNGKVTDPTGQIEAVKIPRIDAALFNAGIGGWEGLNWFGLASQALTLGLIQATTYPTFKRALPSAVILDSQKLIGDGGAASSSSSPPPDLAEVFCANVFGHYILAHELLQLLIRPSSEKSLVPGRVVWTSSVDAERGHLDVDNDFQAVKRQPPYESSKRITDLIALTADLPSIRPIAESYFSSPSKTEDKDAQEKPTKPRFYLSHPGVVCTPIFPLNAFLYFWYWVVMNVSRWCGSPWHTVGTYDGACATAWLALADQEDLDAQNAHRAKWGSSVTRRGHAAPKKSEVQGWAWEGEIEDEEALRKDKEVGVLSKSKGRKWDAQTLTEEERLGFEEDARRCWAELERLRIAWETALGRK